MYQPSHPSNNPAHHEQMVMIQTAIAGAPSCGGYHQSHPVFIAETWPGVKSHLRLGMDYSYPMDPGGSPVLPKDVQPLHTFNTPNGLQVEALRLIAGPMEVVRFTLMPLPMGDACCDLSFFMKAGETMVHLVGDRWHDREILKVHNHQHCAPNLSVINPQTFQQRLVVPPTIIRLVYSAEVLTLI